MFDISAFPEIGQMKQIVDDSDISESGHTQQTIIWSGVRIYDKSIAKAFLRLPGNRTTLHLVLAVSGDPVAW